MVFENDPFEDFKRKRQVRELETTFRKDAASRHAHLENLVRSTSDKSELADRIELEMEDFFSDSQAQVSRIIRQHDHPDQDLIDEKVQEEMSDFFRESKEAAAEILESLGDSENGLDDAAGRMVDHLKNVFEQSMEHIADVQEKYGVGTVEPAAPESGPAVTSLSDLVQSVNESPEGADAFRPGATVRPVEPGDAPNQDMPVDLSVLDDILADPVPQPESQPPAAATMTPIPSPEPPVSASPPPAATAPAPAPVAPAPAPVAPAAPPAAETTTEHADAPPKVTRGSTARVSTEPPETPQAAPQRILRRQAHLPARKGSKGAISPQEFNELRALKQILLQKGIVTREELDQVLGRVPDTADPSA